MDYRYKVQNESVDKLFEAILSLETVILVSLLSFLRKIVSYSVGKILAGREDGIIIYVEVSS